MKAGKSSLTLDATVTRPLAAMAKPGAVPPAGVDFAMTWSCYAPEPDERACGRCDSCVLRKKGFAGARLADPVPAAR